MKIWGSIFLKIHVNKTISFSLNKQIVLKTKSQRQQTSLLKDQHLPQNWKQNHKEFRNEVLFSSPLYITYSGTLYSC